MNKRYKLVEITHEEHLTLADAGVWVQWDTDFGEPDGWYSLDRIAELESGVRRSREFISEYNYKFYTRVEIDDNELQ